MFPSIIRDKLQELRGVLRFCVTLDGTTRMLFVIGALMLLDLAADRYLEWSLAMRGVLLVAIFAGIGYLLWKTLVQRLIAPVQDRQLAALLERKVPEFNESLITSVELRDSFTDVSSEPISNVSREDECFPLLLNTTVTKAAEILKSVDVRELFRFRRLYGRGVLVFLFLSLLIGFCIAFHESTRIWFYRNILLSDIQWPRLSRISVEGFDENGYVRVARGDSFPLLIKADTKAPQVPSKVYVRIAPENDPKKDTKTILIDQFGSRVDEQGAEHRQFLHTIPELLDSVVLSIQAGDTRIEGLRIEVVPPPSVIRNELVLQYPAYMKREDSSLQPTDRVSIPEGTNVSLLMQSNKPLRAASVSLNAQSPLQVHELAGELLRHEFKNLREATRLEVFLEDFDNIKNRRPIRLDMEILKDQSPVVAARLDGIGQAITPIALLPILGEVTDDYGLTEIRSRYSLLRTQGPVLGEPAEKEESDTPKTEPTAEIVTEKETEGTRPIRQLNGIVTNQPLEETFSVSELLLVPGDRLKLQLEAVDGFSLSDPESPQETLAPHVGLGDSWDLEIVTEARLKTILETREIGLRQRFEALIAEVRRTREILETMDFEKTAEEIAADEAAKAEQEKKAEEENNGEEKSETESETKSAETVPPPEPKLEVITQEQAVRGAYDTSRVLRDSEKEKYELQGIIAAFSGIRKEMVNNQIFTPEAQDRIDGRIIEPIRSLMEKDFFEFDEKLTEHARRIEQRETTARKEILDSRLDSIAQIDRILVKMDTILEQMLQMETFNEAIELLKAIIREQESLRKETDKAKNQQLRNLLE